MWIFDGKYSGESKNYIKRKEKKGCFILSFIMSIFMLALSFGLAIAEPDLVAFSLSVGFGLTALFDLAMFLIYRLSEPKSTIEITNDSFDIHDSNGNYSFPFYRVGPIEYYDDFIVIQKKYVLQKELLVKGSWEDLKILLKQIEESLDSDEPMYRINEPQAEITSAKVIQKRIYEKFEPKGSIEVQVGVFHYFATFELEDGTTVEYEIGKGFYDKIETEQTGTLVTVNGNFFDFDDGTEIE